MLCYAMFKTNSKQQTTNNKQTTTNNKQRTATKTNTKQQTTNRNEQPTANKQQTTNNKQQTENNKQEKQTTNNRTNRQQQTRNNEEETTKHNQQNSSQQTPSFSYTGYRKAGSHWVCQECHYPECGFCKQRPLHSIVHNSFVEKSEYDERIRSHVLQPHPDAAEAFASGGRCYICSACKYPTCQTAGCKNTRPPHSRSAFLPWTCDACKPIAMYPECGLCKQRALHSIPQNSFVEKSDYDEAIRSHVLQPHPHAAEAFAIGGRCYICSACKYPSCQTAGCNSTRPPNLRNRFLPWTCDSCKLVCGLCKQRPLEKMVHNSFVEKSDYDEATGRHGLQPHP